MLRLSLARGVTDAAACSMASSSFIVKPVAKVAFRRKRGVTWDGAVSRRAIRVGILFLFYSFVNRYSFRSTILLY
jgi:hypothetical protein